VVDTEGILIKMEFVPHIFCADMSKINAGKTESSNSALFLLL
jgi:hypothetical protein